MTSRPAQPAVDSGELSPGDFRDRVIALLGRPNFPEALAERVKKSDAAHALAQVSTWTAANPKCEAIFAAALSDVSTSQQQLAIGAQFDFGDAAKSVQCATGLLQLIAEAVRPTPKDWTTCPSANTFRLSASCDVTLICDKGELDKRRVLTAGTFVPVHADVATAARNEGLVPIIYGESGAGKTMTCVGAAQALRAPAAVYFTPDGMTVTRPPKPAHEEQGETTGAYKEARNEAALDYVLKVVTHYIPEEHRRPHPDPLRPFVLILDEFGQHPYFVRGLIAGQVQVRQRIRGLLGLAAETKVVLIVAGTGVEGASLKAGSKPTDSSCSSQ